MVVEERPKPSAREGCTLVRMHSATINQLSNALRKGEFGAAKAPFVPGNEGSGECATPRRRAPALHGLI
jgi:NADPH2:quinone reductase